MNLRGFDPTGVPLDPDDVIHDFLSALLLRPEQTPPTAGERAALYRSLVADRRMLVVLDNARNAEQVRPLLPGGTSCLTLVTSRSRMAGLVADPGARPVRLGPLPDDDARTMLRRMVGAARMDAEPEAVDELLRFCAGLPLALSVVGAMGATSPSEPLTAVAEELRDERRRLDVLETADLGHVDKGVRAVLSWSYAALDERTRRVFRLLGTVRGRDVDLRAAASLVGESVRSIRAMLAVLTQVHLLDTRMAGRYEMHDLVRVYAAERAEAEDSADDRRACVSQLLDFYLHTAVAAAYHFDRYRESLVLAPPSPDVVRMTIADYPQAMAWFTAEHSNLVAAIDQAVGLGFDGHVWRLAWTLNDYFHRRGYWEEIVVTQGKALAAATRLGDDAAAAIAHRLAGRADVRVRRFDRAVSHQLRALALWERLGDQVGQAHAHLGLGYAAEEEGRNADAIPHAERARTLYRAAGHPAGQARSLNGLAWNHGMLGHYDIAIALAEEGLALQRRLGNRHGEADTLDTLGYVRLCLGDLAAAIRDYSQALVLWHDLGDDNNEAWSRVQLGEVYLKLGHRDVARREWCEALVAYERLHQPDEAAARRRRLRELDEDEPSPSQPPTSLTAHQKHAPAPPRASGGRMREDLTTEDGS